MKYLGQSLFGAINRITHMYVMQFMLFLENENPKNESHAM